MSICLSYTVIKEGIVCLLVSLTLEMPSFITIVKSRVSILLYFRGYKELQSRRKCSRNVSLLCRSYNIFKNIYALRYRNVGRVENFDTCRFV